MIIEFNKAVEIIKDGGIVAFPTETVYGLGARADIQTSVDKVYHIKKRPKDNPLICHFANFNDVYNYIDEVPSFITKLVRDFVPGPLSFRFNLPENSPLLPATAGQTAVVCRVPSHDLTRNLILEIGSPIVGPSANTSGKVSNTSAKMVEQDLGNLIDGILDGGECTVGIESTIIDCTSENKITILRPGFIKLGDIQSSLSSAGFEVEIEEFGSSLNSQVTPGMKYKHYSPDTPLIKIVDLLHLEQILEVQRLNDSGIAILSFYEDLEFIDRSLLSIEKLKLINLGSVNNPSEIATNLYSNIKSVDTFQVFLNESTNSTNCISAMFFVRPETEQKLLSDGLGRAIMNRLNRATSQY